MPCWQNRSVWVPVLAYLGLLPFAGCIVADRVFQVPLASVVFQAYGLAIATFLLGSWWGIALTRTALGRMPWLEIGLSNGLVILAVLIMVLLPLVWALLAQGCLFVLLGAVEGWRPVFRSAPGYYRAMRRRVTVSVALLHALMALLKMSAPG